MEQKIKRFLSNAMKNKAFAFIVRSVIHIIWRFERFVGYFKKDVSVHANYIHYMDEETGEYMKKPDSFRIYIIQKGKAERHWSEIDWEERERIIELLTTAKRHVQLDMKVGMGTSSLFIPKWAKGKIVKELEKIKDQN